MRYNDFRSFVKRCIAGNQQLRCAQSPPCVSSRTSLFTPQFPAIPLLIRRSQISEKRKMFFVHPLLRFFCCYFNNDFRDNENLIASVLLRKILVKFLLPGKLSVLFFLGNLCYDIKKFNFDKVI